MKKINIIFLLLLSILIFASCNSNDTNKNEVETVDYDLEIDESIANTMDIYIEKLITETSDCVPYWNKENYKGKWNYIDGVFLNSIINIYYNVKTTDSEKANYYKEFFLKYINYYIDEEGNFLDLLDETAEGYKKNELDTVCESRILFDAYELTGEERYINSINYTYDALMSQPRVANSNNNFAHKRIYAHQIWLDGMYMYAPFYARYALATNNNEIFDGIKGHYEFIRNTMYDEEKGLYYHGYSSKMNQIWCDKETGLSPSFWLRSMGWYIMSLVDVLDYFPKGENKEYLISLLVEALEGILQYQDQESKMFYQLIDQGPISVYVDASYFANLKNTKYTTSTYVDNYLESSGSSMVAYALMKAAKFGYIDLDYVYVGAEIFEGIYKHSFYDNSLHDICITAGLGPITKEYRDGSHAYYLAEPVGSDDAKGVGPFIMAYLEYSSNKIIKPKTPSIL